MGTCKYENQQIEEVKTTSFSFFNYIYESFYITNLPNVSDYPA